MTSLLEPDTGWKRAVRGARASLVITVVASMIIGLYLGWKEGYLRPSKEFHFNAGSSRSISTGTAVYVSGFKIGQVSAIALQPDQTVRVDMDIYSPYLDLIRRDSEVVLVTGGLIGDYSLEIIGGERGEAVAEPGSDLVYRRQVEWSDQLGEVIEQVKPMIENADALLAQARAPDGELQTSLRSLAATATRLEEWVPGFLERANDTLASLERTTGAAENLLGPLAQPDGDLQSALRELRTTAAVLPPLVDDLTALTKSLMTTATSLENSVSEFAPELPGLVSEGRRTAAGAGDVVDAVKDFSLIGGKIADREPQPVLPTTQP